MGVPAVLIPEHLFPNLPSILSGTGAKITEEPFGDESVKSGFKTVLNCTNDDGEMVRVECQPWPYEPPGTDGRDGGDADHNQTPDKIRPEVRLRCGWPIFYIGTDLTDDFVCFFCRAHRSALLDTLRLLNK